jgi:pilus assembly protein CpaD
MTIARAGALALAVFAAGCAYPTSDPWNEPLPQDRWPITVRESRSMAEVPVQAERFKLSYDDIASVEAMGWEYINAGRGAIIIALPIGGGNDEAAVAVGAEARDVLAAQGIAYRAIRGTSYDAGGRADAPIVVMVDRYVAEGPDCHQEWRDFARTWTGENTYNFGCAMQANLAAVVTDPGDFLGPRGQTPPDAGRRAVVLTRYRNGETTITERDLQRESSQVSDAVE